MDSAARDTIEAALEAEVRGDRAEAARLYERALAQAPEHPIALHNLGLLRAAEGRRVEAEALVARAVAQEPDDAQALFNLAQLRLRLGRRDEAAQALERAVAVRPDWAEAHARLGEVEAQRGRLDVARAAWARALALDPHCTPALTAEGADLMAQGDFNGAGRRFALVLALRPDQAPAALNVAKALKGLGRLDEAADFYGQALALKPDYAEAWMDLGNLRREQERLDAARDAYLEAVRLAPADARVRMNFGHILRERGEWAASTAAYRQALSLAPEDPVALMAEVMGRLPILYDSVEQIEQARRDYAEGLENLAQCLPRLRGRTDLSSALGAAQPFQLPYAGRNDRALQARYGEIVQAMAADRFPAPARVSPLSRRRIRLGLVSGQFRGHSVWKTHLNGWLQTLDREGFEVLGYHTSLRQDERTETARALCDGFVQGPLSAAAWRERLLADAPDVLIYPEIGMDPMSVQLAAQRLAPLQATSWGHPVTSGLPTVDLYLSSALMEPEDGQDHYVERLVRLPHLGVWYAPHEAESAVKGLRSDRAALGLPEGVLYWAPQSLFKFLPEHDGVFARIAARLPEARFVFIAAPGAPEVTERFQARLARAFAAEGLEAARFCVFLRRLTREGFTAIAAASDVFLDSLGWAGCNTTLESLETGLPLVSWRGPLMRGRHGAAILERMEMTETLADDIADYAEFAVRLGRDAGWRAELRGRIAERRGRLHRDEAPVRALEQVLRSELARLG